jgi:flavodoxin
MKPMKGKDILITGILAAVLLSSCGCTSSASVSSSTAAASTEASVQMDDSDEIENYTRYADYTPAEAEDLGITEGSNGNILVAYFSRSANTALSGVDAVSSASLTFQDDNAALGNAEQMAEWIANETGADLYPIQTMYTYPVDYDLTVDVGEGQNEDDVLPVLINPIDLSSYDLVFLVTPIWHYTLPAPVASFLDEYDFSGKTIGVFTTSDGSGFADAIERVEEAEPEASVVEGTSVFQSDLADSEEKVRSAAADLIEAYAPAQKESMAEQQTIQVQVGDEVFTAELESNETAAAFLQMLPLTLQMSELNGNEKYAYGVSLPANEEAVGTIAEGDLMLFGDDCLVLFYDSFDTVYSYTRIGHVEDPEGLAEVVGNGDVEVTFSAQ